MDPTTIQTLLETVLRDYGKAPLGGGRSQRGVSVCLSKEVGVAGLAEAVEKLVAMASRGGAWSLFVTRVESLHVVATGADLLLVTLMVA